LVSAAGVVGFSAREFWTSEKRYPLEVANQGHIKWFNNNKGWGFIAPEDGGEDIFVHYSEIHGDGFKTLQEGDPVNFELVEGPKGSFAKTVTKA
jgi:CspA family cold shock protein